MSSKYWPPGGFYFRVSIDGMQTAFQEVSGLEYEVDVETVKGGGDNAKEIKYPGRLKYNNIVCKRGHVPGGGAVWANFVARFNPVTGLAGPIPPQFLMIELLDEQGIPLTIWNVIRAYPVKWNVAGLNSMDSKVLIESVEFAHHGIILIPGMTF